MYRHVYTYFVWAFEGRKLNFRRLNLGRLGTFVWMK